MHLFRYSYEREKKNLKKSYIWDTYKHKLMSDFQNIDYLTVDTPIPGQSFVCLSFLSPEKVLAQKSEFYMAEFWRTFQNSEKRELNDVDILDEYRSFVDMHEKTLDDKFNEENGNQTSIRGIKVRGVYDNYKEAEIRSKALQQLDPNHHVFVGSVGYWLPWDPSPDRIVDQKYQEEQLNDLMKGYNENVEKRNAFYQVQKEERKAQIIQENNERKQRNATEQLFDSENIETASMK